jgi:hypothetical protein
MAKIIITYWRDIPSQVTAKAGRKAEKKMLSDQFQEAIDMAAMRSATAESGDYLDEWRRGDPVECGDDLMAAVTRTAEQLDGDYNQDRIKALVASGGTA